MAQNKCVFRATDKEIICIEQNGHDSLEMKGKIPKFWAQITVYNYSEGISYHETSFQDQLRDYWIGTTRQATENEIHTFLVKFPEYRFYRFMKKVPYSIFVKEW